MGRDGDGEASSSPDTTDLSEERTPCVVFLGNRDTNGLDGDGEALGERPRAPCRSRE